MKKIIITGGVVVIIVMTIVMIVFVFQKNKKEYEYYDFGGNYGTSSNCNSNDKVTCLTKNGWIEVSQYSEVVE